MIADLPPVPHLPGRTPRPPESAFADLKNDLSRGLSPAELAASPAFHEGLRAFSERYYWEAHELFEAVWTYLPPASAERHLVQGLIQLANAGLKGRMERDKAAIRIGHLAESAIAEAFRGQAAPMGLTRRDVAAMEKQAYAEIAK